MRKSLTSFIIAAALLAVSFGITALVMKGLSAINSVPKASAAELLVDPVEVFSIRLNGERQVVLPGGTTLSEDFFLNALKLGGEWTDSGTGRVVLSNRGSIEIPVSLTPLSGDAVERLLNAPLGECVEEKSIFWGGEAKGVSFSLESRSASLQIDLVPVESGKWNIVALKSFSPGAPIGRGSAHIGSIRYVCSGGTQFAESIGSAIAALVKHKKRQG